MSMVYLADKIARMKSDISNEEVKQDIVVLYGSSLPDTFGYASVFDEALYETTFTTGSAIEYKQCDGKKTITIPESFDSENVTMMGNLTKEAIAGTCDHWRKVGDNLIETRGFATITYKQGNDGQLMETSSIGLGFQEGIESCFLSDVMRYNYDDDYTTTDCIYQETLARYYMGREETKNALITGALTSDTTSFENVLAESETDLTSFLSMADELKKQEEARKAGDITPQQLDDYYVVNIVPFVNAISKEIGKTM